VNGPLTDEEAVALNDFLGLGVEVPLAVFDEVPEESVPTEQPSGQVGNFQSTVPDVVYPAKLQTPVLSDDFDAEEATHGNQR
jgi:hypothetical protein